jgi:hypothetical protein
MITQAIARILSIFAAISCASVLRCSSPGSSESIGETQSQAVTSCSGDCVTGDTTQRVDDTSSPILQLATGGYSVNTELGTATLLTTGGTAITVTSTTRVKHTPIGLWIPTDPLVPSDHPCIPSDPIYPSDPRFTTDPYLPVARAWNTLVQSAAQPAEFGSPTIVEGSRSFSSLMLQFAHCGRHVRVALDSSGTTALSLRPLP